MSRPFPIAHVVWIGRTSLSVTWHDGGASCVDLAGWIASDQPRLAALRDCASFALAQVATGGSGLAWGEVGIDGAHLWRIAAEQRAFSRAELAAWQAEIGLSNQEAAEFLGISLSAWNTYKAGTNPIPALVAMVCRAALRDPILRQARYKPRTRGRPRKPEIAARPASAPMTMA